MHLQRPLPSLPEAPWSYPVSQVQRAAWLSCTVSTLFEAEHKAIIQAVRSCFHAACSHKPLAVDSQQSFVKCMKQLRLKQVDHAAALSRSQQSQVVSPGGAPELTGPFLDALHVLWREPPHNCLQRVSAAL